MLEKLKKIKENKILKIIWNILYTLLFILVALMFIVVIIQRASNNSITVGGVRIFNVATGSMVPVYEIGDVLIAKEITPEEIKVDDDIVYKGEKGSFKDKIVTHRVISIEKQEDGNYRIITKGVANTIEDPEINQTQVYGKVIYKVQILSLLAKLMQNIYVFYFIVFVPIALFICKKVKNIINYDEDEEDDEK